MALGALADKVRSHLPESYRALTSASYYGEELIQDHIDDVKYKFFATVVSATTEASFYDRYVLRYVGKVATLEIIPSAIEYWMNQLISETTSGTDEQAVYPSRVAALEKLYARLASEIKSEAPEFNSFVNPIIRLSGASPKVDTSAEDLRTSDPKEFRKEFQDIRDWSRVIS